jgi:hypothetical protein
MIERFALIIGAMKCGTSSLFNYLAQHPEIAESRPKEIGFFDNDDHWARGRDWYEAAWRWDPAQHRVALEASTGYTKVPTMPNAAARIATYPAKFQFLYIMRNPLDRYESHYSHKDARKELQQARISLKEALKDFGHALVGRARYAGQRSPVDWVKPDSGHEEVRAGLRRARVQLNRALTDFDPHMVATSQYARQLDEYYQRFPAGDILLLNLDDLSATPLVVLRRICQFLGVDPDFQFSGTDRRHNRFDDAPGTHLRAEAIARSPGVSRVLRLVPKSAKQAVRRLLARRQSHKHARLDPQERQALLAILTPDLRRLRDEFGFDPACWNLRV